MCSMPQIFKCQHTRKKMQRSGEKRNDLRRNNCESLKQALHYLFHLIRFLKINKCYYAITKYLIFSNKWKADFN